MFLEDQIWHNCRNTEVISKRAQDQWVKWEDGGRVKGVFVM